MMRHALMLVSLLLASPVRAQPAASTPEASFLPLWDELPQHAGWQMLVSPAFPGAWPQPAGGAVVRYAFAMRLTASLADGVEVAAPWARSTLGAAGDIAVERLSARLQPLGIQGVRPLGSAEVALAAREQDAASLLRTGGPAATDGVVRAFTCGWIARQGVVAATILPRHPGFADWLACSLSERASPGRP